MANLLDQLAAMTVVVADTGDIDAIRQFTPRDADRKSTRLNSSHRT